MSYFILRTFLEVQNYDEAKMHGSKIVKLIDKYCSPKIFNIEKYWKLPHLYTVVIEIKDVNNIDDLFLLMEKLAVNWSGDIHYGFFWNDEYGKANIKELTWAHIELIEN